MRKVRFLSLLAVVVLLLAACGGGESAPAAEQPTAAVEATAAPATGGVTETTSTTDTSAAAPAAADAGAKEAPALAELVKAGKLPPLDERLPKEPFVVGPGVLLSKEDLPNWTPGQYGGTINTAHSVADWAPDVFVMLNEPLLQAPGLSVQDIKGNVLKSFEVNADNTEFTFHLREGLKWSDGEPVTTADVKFVYENIYGNEKISPTGPPARFRNGFDPAGEPGKLAITDDYNFKMTFTKPYGGFLRNLTIEGWNGYTELIRPSHFLKQFHGDFAKPDELKALLAKANLKDEWWQLYTANDCQNWNDTADRCIGFPTLNPWVSVKSQSTGVKTFERNPYYWKVDTDGKQLPYIDKIVSVQVEDVEMVNQRVLTGDIDYLRESTGLVKVPLYKENEEKAGFNTVLLDMHVDASALFLNETFKDETWRKLVRDIRFRQALSMALNRQEFIDSIYYSFAALPLTSVGDENSKYDVAKANALLDEVGMKEKDADGFRMGPDGKPFAILLEHGAHAPDLQPSAELVAAQLKEVGIKVNVKRIDSTLWGSRNTANELQATVFWTHDQGWDSGYTGGIFDITAPDWALWHTSNGKKGEEPPAWAKQAWDLDVKRWSSVSGSDEYNKLKEEGYAWSRTNLPVIQIVEGVKYAMIANKKLQNVPQAGFAIAANFAGEQLWYGQ